MFLFERAKAAKGKNREPGLQAFCVSKMTGRQLPPGVFLPKKAYFVVTPFAGVGPFSADLKEINLPLPPVSKKHLPSTHPHITSTTKIKDISM